MKKVANFLINQRYIILAIMLVIAIVCGLLIAKVPINKDRTEYLADDSGMKQGLSIMESEFPETAEKASIRVMFDDLTAEQISDVKARLKAIPNVSSVTYEADSEDYNKDNKTLFVVNSKFDYNTDEEKAIEHAIEIGFPEFTVTYRNNDIQSTEVPMWLIIIAIALLVAVLLIMSHSWLDPVLFLVTIGIAVVINMGTNIFLPHTDELTVTVGPILQLVLSMDYSIILMTRYRQEKDKYSNKFDRMKAALAGSVSSIVSSSLTTVVGLLALVFLSFKLGPELGIVLAKGVFISMLCVFTLLPVMILWFDNALEKTRKKAPHIPMGLLAKISHKARYAMPAIFAFLLVGSFILQSFTTITFTEKSDDPLADIFPKDNTVIVIYHNKDEDKIPRIVSELEKDDRIVSVLGYSNTLGKKMNAKEMSEAVSSLGDDVAIDKDLIQMIYFIAADGELPTLTVAEFMNFITETILPNETFKEYLDEDISENIEYFEKFSDKETLTAPMTADEMVAFFGIEKKSIEQLYLFYTIQNGVADSGTMTLPTFVDFVLNTVARDETYGAMFDSVTLSSLKQLQGFTDKNNVQAGRTVSELAAVLGIDEDLVKTVFVLHNAGDVSGKTMTLSEFSAFLCEHMIKDPMFSSHFDDATKTQIQTLHGLIQLAASKQGLTAEQMAQTLGMEKDNISGLYYLYFAADPAFQQEVAATKMPLADFLTLLKANTSGDQLEQLTQMEQLISLAVSGQPLDADTMAAITGMDANQIGGIYMMNSVQAMTLPDFLAAALALAPDNTQLQQLNQLIQLAVSGTALDGATLASVFGIETAQVYQLFGFTLSAQKTIAFADFTNFLVNSVLSNEAYAGSFTPEQATQLQQMNGIVQLVASGATLDANALAQTFGMDAAMITTVFRLYFGADISGKTMSLKAFADFILSDPMISSMMDKTSAQQLRFMQSIITASLNGTAFTSEKLASFLGMDTAQAEQLYILYMNENGSSWKLSPQDFVSFVVTNVLNDDAFAGQFDKKSANDLKLGHTLIEAVVSDKEYTVGEMSELLGAMSDAVSIDEIEIMYLYYGGVNDTDVNRTMTIPQLFNYLCDEMLNDKRFESFFDENTKADVLSSKTDLTDAIAQMKGDTYSRLVITSDYPDESSETHTYIGRINELCGNELDEYYLVGNSVMVSEMDAAFDNEYLMITLITAFAVFFVVLIAFRNPTLPLILTLIVQCGVFITVAVTGAYSGSIYYLALLIVQSILMGATIDYGIVFCNFYKESRKMMPVPDALKAAYEASIHTIMTSSTMLIFALAAIGIFVKSAIISEVCITLAIGVLVAVILILFILPGMVACCDRLLGKRKETQIK